MQKRLKIAIDYDGKTNQNNPSKSMEIKNFSDAIKVYENYIENEKNE